MRRTTTLAIRVLLFCAVVIHLQATTITVTNTNDSGPGSLRQALADANNGDTINFAVTRTIFLTSGEIVARQNCTISGPGMTICPVANSLADTRVVYRTLSVSPRMVEISSSKQQFRATSKRWKASCGGCSHCHRSARIRISRHLFSLMP
jgi:hypothetical protein